MLLRFFFFLVGFGLVIIGLSTIILYINLFAFGYNFKEYIKYIIKLNEFYYAIIGFILINISVLKKGKSRWFMILF